MVGGTLLIECEVQPLILVMMDLVMICMMIFKDSAPQGHGGFCRICLIYLGDVLATRLCVTSATVCIRTVKIKYH